MVFLDYSNLNPDGEPKVILASCQMDTYEQIDTLADDFGDFILELVQEMSGE
jgi:hypothetical protein